MPPKFKCTFDNQFYDGYHSCHLDLKPVIHAKWLEGYGLIDCVDGDPDESYMVPTWICSNCKSEEEHITDYCPNCGSKMDGEKYGTTD
jgi:hypothetical protein